jgi:hypothetical protein
MNNKIGMSVMKRLWLILRYFPGICLEGLGKTTELRSHLSLCRARESNRPLSNAISEASPLGLTLAAFRHK